MKELKTVQDVLRKLDTEKLVGTYRWHFPIGYEERVELLDMTVRDIQERVKAGLRLLIERLRTLPIKPSADGQQGLLFVHRIMKNGSHDRAYELVFIDELLRDGVNCNSYAYEFTEQAEILGFLVADTPLTQRYIYDLIADAMHQASFFGFAQEDLAGELEKLKQSYERSRDACDYLVAHKLVVNLSQVRNRSEYMFTLQKEGPLEEEMVNVEVPDGDYSPVLIARLQKMVTAGSSERDQRIGSFILNMIDNSTERFSTEDWVEAFHVTKPVYTNDLRRAVNFGLLRKENPRGNCTHYTYVIPKGPYEEVRCSDLTKIQRELLGKIHRQFKKDEFTVRDASRVTGCSETSISFHLSNFAERGIMAVHNHPEFPGHAQGYSLAIFPKDHPDCFMPETEHIASTVGGGYTADRAPIAAASA